MTFSLMAHLWGQASKLSPLYNTDLLLSALSFLPGSVHLCWGRLYQMCLCDGAILLLAGTIASRHPASAFSPVYAMFPISNSDLGNCFVSDLQWCSQLPKTVFETQFACHKWSKLEYVIQRFWFIHKYVAFNCPFWSSFNTSEKKPVPFSCDFLVPSAPSSPRKTTDLHSHSLSLSLSLPLSLSLIFSPRNFMWMESYGLCSSVALQSQHNTIQGQPHYSLW